MNLIRSLLRVLSTIAALIYTTVLIDEAFPPYDPNMRESNLGLAMVFILFIWFGIGYYLSWKDERSAGLIYTTWWLALVATAWLIWEYGNVTVILGFPIFLLGILLIIYSWKKAANPPEHPAA